MAVSGALQISGTIFNLPEGGPLTIGPLTIASANAIGESLPLALVSGNNAVPVPAGATALLFIPPAGNAQAILLKGVNGDTGVALSKTLPALIPVDTGATIVLNAAGSVAAKIVWL